MPDPCNPSQCGPDLGEVEDVEGDLAVLALHVLRQLDGAEEQDDGRRDPGQDGALLVEVGDTILTHIRKVDVLLNSSQIF